MKNVVRGKARVDGRTKSLVKRLSSCDIAIIDHADLDQLAAESLISCRPRAVVNCSASITGRYPNTGPLSLIRAGVPIIEASGSLVMQEIRDGDSVLITRDAIYRNGNLVSAVIWLDEDTILAKLALAQDRLKLELASFVDNTLVYAKQEQGLILGGYPAPAIRTNIKGRQALVVVRGHHHRQDIQAIRTYIQEVKPVLIGVDGGADALLELGMRPDLIVGDMDSVSDSALQTGAEIVVHAYTDGTAPGAARIERLGLPAVFWPAPGTSEDIALLLAYDQGAEVIVAVGTHSNMLDFLEKGRQGMASTFLVRLKVGSRLVDARGVSRLYHQSLHWSHLAGIFAAALIPLVMVLTASPASRHYFQLLMVHLLLLLQI